MIDSILEALGNIFTPRVITMIMTFVFLAAMTIVKQYARKKEEDPETAESIRKVMHMIRLVLEFGSANDGEFNPRIEEKVKEVEEEFSDSDD